MEVYIKKVKDLIEENKDKLKIVALPFIVVVAILFFWFSGNQDDDIKIAKGEHKVLSNETYEEKDLDSVNKVDVKREIYVDIGGAVTKPGVYKVNTGTRLFQVIEMAGGLLGNAITDDINQAKEVFDGEKVIIPDETSQKISTEVSNENNRNYGNNMSEANGKININSADSATLQEIPGIGSSKADKIIEYRTNVGPFKTIEDIKNISGIGDKTFETIKEFIIV